MTTDAERFSPESGTGPSIPCPHCGAVGDLVDLRDDPPFFEDDVGSAVWTATLPLPLFIGALLLQRADTATTAVTVAAVFAIEIALIAGFRFSSDRRRTGPREPVAAASSASRPVREPPKPETPGSRSIVPPPHPAPSLAAAVPERPADPVVARLDEAELAARRRDSELARQSLQHTSTPAAAATNAKRQSAATLAAEPAVAPTRDGTAVSNLLGALEEDERPFASVLAQREFWSLEEFSGLARQYHLMPSAAIDIINEASLQLLSVSVLRETPSGIAVDIESFRRSLS